MTSVSDLSAEVIQLKEQVRKLLNNSGQLNTKELRLLLGEIFREEEKIKEIRAVKYTVIISSVTIILLLLGIISLILFTEPI